MEEHLSELAKLEKWLPTAAYHPLVRAYMRGYLSKPIHALSDIEIMSVSGIGRKRLGQIKEAVKMTKETRKEKLINSLKVEREGAEKALGIVDKFGKCDCLADLGVPDSHMGAFSTLMDAIKANHDEEMAGVERGEEGSYQNAIVEYIDEMGLADAYIRFGIAYERFVLKGGTSKEVKKASVV